MHDMNDVRCKLCVPIVATTDDWTRFHSKLQLLLDVLVAYKLVHLMTNLLNSFKQYLLYTALEHTILMMQVIRTDSC